MYMSQLTGVSFGGQNKHGKVGGTLPRGHVEVSTEPGVGSREGQVWGDGKLGGKSLVHQAKLDKGDKEPHVSGHDFALFYCSKQTDLV